MSAKLWAPSARPRLPVMRLESGGRGGPAPARAGAKIRASRNHAAEAALWLSAEGGGGGASEDAASVPGPPSPQMLANSE